MKNRFSNDQELLSYAWNIRDDQDGLTNLERYARCDKTLAEIQHMAAMAYVREDCEFDDMGDDYDYDYDE